MNYINIYIFKFICKYTNFVEVPALGSVGLEERGCNMAAHLQLFPYFFDGKTKGKAGLTAFFKYESLYLCFMKSNVSSFVFPIKLDSEVDGEQV